MWTEARPEIVIKFLNTHAVHYIDELTSNERKARNVTIYVAYRQATVKSMWEYYDQLLEKYNGWPTVHIPAP